MRSATDFHRLGRLGTAEGALDGGAIRRRLGVGGGRTRMVRRRGPGTPAVQAATRLPLPAVAVGAVLLLLILLWAVGAAVGSQTSVLSAVALASPDMDAGLEASLKSADAPLMATGAIALVPGGGSSREMMSTPSAFAAIGDTALHLPFALTERVVFMEADTATALPLAPVGTMVANDNPDGFVEAEPLSGPDYAVAAPITGVRPATGAAALLAAPGTTVMAPVQGTVEAVTTTTSETGETDHRIVIRPEGRHDLHVVIRRIDVPFVGVGDTVTVGRTEIGTVRAGVVVGPELNPLALPAALLHVQPAVEDPEQVTAAPGTASTGT